MKKAALLILLTVAPAGAAFDNARLVQHLRENLSLDTRTEIVVQGEPVASGISDLKKVVVLVAGAPYDVLLTKDGKQYIWGLVADLSTSPDKIRADGISLQGAHSIGDASAPVTVVEYSDLQCSFCRKAHDMLKEKIHTVYTPAQVKFVFKHFPLNSHAWAVPSAAVSECAARQQESAFWKMTDFYFANQDKITEADVVEKGLAEAKRIGLKPELIKTCMEDPSVKGLIEAQKKEGAAVGVSSTPTLFINGRMRRGFRDFDDVKVLIDEKLKAAKK